MTTHLQTSMPPRGRFVMAPDYPSREVPCALCGRLITIGEPARVLCTVDGVVESQVHDACCQEVRQ